MIFYCKDYQLLIIKRIIIEITLLLNFLELKSG